MSVDTPLGHVLRDDTGLRLEYLRTFTRTEQQVWAAMTDPDLLARWIGTVTGDPDTGVVQFLMTEDKDGSPEPLTILTCDPPRALDVSMGSADGAWPLSVTLTETQPTDVSTTHPGTILTFTQRLAEPFDASSIGPGWHYYLDRLQAVVDGKEPTEDWDAYYPSLASAYKLPDGL